MEVDSRRSAAHRVEFFKVFGQADPDRVILNHVNADHEFRDRAEVGLLSLSLWEGLT